MSDLEQIYRSLSMEHRVLVCGGRDFSYRDQLFSTLDTLCPQPTLIIHGAARGADHLASQWAASRGVTQMPMPADWDRYGKSAGFRRNAEMLSAGHPHLVVAFPGGRGTQMMTDLARKAGVEVLFA